MEFSVPIFVGSGTPAVLDWSLQNRDGGLSLNARNSGGTRAQISQIELLDAAGKSVLKQAGLYGYVLAGQQRRWSLELPPQAAPHTPQARIKDESIRAQIRAAGARKSVVSGKSVSVRVDLGGGRFIKKQKNK